MRAVIACLLVVLAALPVLATEGEDVVHGAARLRFEGNRAFSGTALAKVIEVEVDDFIRGGFDEIDAEDAADRLQRFYLNEGHARAIVDYVSTSEEASKGLLRIAIQEGPRFLLGRVKLKGNDSVQDETLLAFVRGQESWLGTPVVILSLLDAALASVETYYIQQGWLGVKIAPPEMKLSGDPGGEEVTADIVVRITEGIRSWFAPEDVVFEGVKGLKPEDLGEVVRALVKDDLDETGRRPYRPGLRARVRAAVLDRYGESGYPFAKVDVRERLSGSKERMTLVCRVVEDERARLAHIEIEGNRGVRDFYIRRELEFDRNLKVERGGTIETGALWHAGRVRNAQIALLRTGLFRSVRIDPVRVEGEPERVDLHVEVRERQLRTVDLRVGWGSYEMIRAGVTLNHRAWDGIGELLGLDWALTALDARLDVEGSTRHLRTAVQLLDRRFLDTRWEAALVTGFETRQNVSYSYTRVSARLGLGRRLVEWDHRVRVETSWSYSRTDIFDVDDDLDKDLEEIVKVSSLSVSLIGDWRNDPIWPSRGGRATLHLEDADERLGGDLSLVRVKVAGDVYLPLEEAGNWVIALAMEGGILFPYGDTDEIPLSERFFSGGSTSVRSFDEQKLGPKKHGSPRGGEAMLVANAELRFPIWKIVHGAVFVDAGNVYRTSGDLDPGDLEYGIGGGIRLRTPVGPLRLDAGWNPDPGEDDPRWAVHFSVGFAF